MGGSTVQVYKYILYIVKVYKSTCTVYIHVHMYMM